jgi:hypothetical protein
VVAGGGVERWGCVGTSGIVLDECQRNIAIKRLRKTYGKTLAAVVLFVPFDANDGRRFRLAERSELDSARSKDRNERNSEESRLGCKVK